MADGTAFMQGLANWCSDATDPLSFDLPSGSLTVLQTGCAAVRTDRRTDAVGRWLLNAVSHCWWVLAPVSWSLRLTECTRDRVPVCLGGLRRQPFDPVAVVVGQALLGAA